MLYYDINRNDYCGVNMPKITVKNIFKNVKYINILRVLNAYEEGLTLKHLGYILIGEKKLIEIKYISKKTAKKIKNYLEEYKNKDYELIPSNDVIKHPTRLLDCLSVLENLRFVKKDNNRKYKINSIVKDILIVKEDMDSLSHYQELSRFIEMNRNILSDSDMSIYASCEFVDAYNDSQEVKEKVDRIKEDMKKLMTELSMLNFEVHRACREKVIDDFKKTLNEPESILGKVIRDKEKLAQAIKDIKDDTELQKGIRNDIEQQKKLMELKPIVTVVMHSVALHPEELHFNPVTPLVSSDGKLLGKLAYQTIEY